MQTGTGIRLNGVTFNNPSLPKLVDYKSELANSQYCEGAWRFDLPELLTQSEAGGVTEVLNWRDGGGSLLSIGTADITTAYSAQTAGTVGVIPAGARLKMDGAFNANQAYTMVVVFKADSFASQQVLAGQYSQDNTESACIRILQSSSAVPILRHHWGGNQAQVAVSASQYVAVFAGINPQESLAPNAELLGGALVESTGTAVDVVDSPLEFFVSNGNLPFVGEIDFVAIFNADINTEQPELKELVENYLSLRV